MYSNQFTAAIKANGKILREFKDNVYIKFGSEYSIYLKNLSTKKALVNVYIDGENIVPGGLVLYAGQTTDLERPIKNGNLNSGNKLKFIERTGSIEAHRGIKAEDGLVRIEWQFEKIFVPVSPSATPAHIWNPNYNDLTWISNLQSTQISSMNATQHPGVACNNTLNGSASAVAASVSSPLRSLSKSMPQNETGITVAGSKSEQQFQTASWFATESTKHSLILQLLGETEDNVPVQKPITVKQKQDCPTCGRKNKMVSKFCSECGTALISY